MDPAETDAVASVSADETTCTHRLIEMRALNPVERSMLVLLRCVWQPAEDEFRFHSRRLARRQESYARRYRFLNSAVRFSRNAPIPSFMSSVLARRPKRVASRVCRNRDGDLHGRDALRRPVFSPLPPECAASSPSNEQRHDTNEEDQHSDSKTHHDGGHAAALRRVPIKQAESAPYEENRLNNIHEDAHPFEHVSSSSSRLWCHLQLHSTFREPVKVTQPSPSSQGRTYA